MVCGDCAVEVVAGTEREEEGSAQRRGAQHRDIRVISSSTSSSFVAVAAAAVAAALGAAKGVS